MEQNAILKLISKWVSAIFNPMFSLVIFFVYNDKYHLENGNFWENFLPILLILILPISIWIFWNVRNGNYTNADVSDQKQRHSLYYFIVTCLVVYIFWSYYYFGTLDLIFMALTLLFVLMMLSNYFVKSSMHTAFNVLVAAFFYQISTTIGSSWLVITLLVAMSRLVLKRHTPAEVIAGIGISTLVALCYLYLS